MSVPAGRDEEGLALSPTVLSEADMIVAAIPHLVGYPPEESVVVVGLAAGGDGGQRVQLVGRVDLPRADAGLGELMAFTQAIVSPVARAGATSAIVVVHSSQDVVPGQPLPRMALADQLVLELAEHAVWTGDPIYTDGAAHCTYPCHDPARGPSGRRVVSEQTRAYVAAQCAAAGLTMAPSRQVLAEEVAAVPDLMAGVRTHLDDIAGPADIEDWRDSAVATITDADTSDPPAPPVCAQILHALRDTRVRDTVLWDLAQPGANSPAVRARLAEVLRSAPPGDVAPVATVLAVQHWLDGDGARAHACVDRALADDPDYGLANHTRHGLRTGVPPTAWTDMMSVLGRDTCRHRDADPAPTRPTAHLVASPPAVMTTRARGIHPRATTGMTA